jgi:predicted nucleotidyltransferase
MPELSRRFSVESLGLFGSYARSQHGPQSDLDLLVSFRTTPGLLGFLELENYLSQLLGIKVDLVMRRALKPHVRQQILRELVPV